MAQAPTSRRGFVMGKVLTGDCVDVMASMPDASVDSVVTDPPYGLGFMGKKWDIGVPAVEVFEQCLRVLKPGGHLLAFGGSRTYHRLAVAVEDAGFEIRDQIMWVYGSGFPKSRNVGREVEEFDGWGTALKPAHEPIVFARKPLTGTVAQNVMEHGTGAINVDGCRIQTNDVISNHSRGADSAVSKGKYGDSSAQETHQTEGQKLGRYPANLIHDGSEEVTRLFPDTGKSSGGTAKAGRFANQYGDFSGENAGSSAGGFGDTGSAARFFYCAKANKKDRTEGGEVENKHPTVKPTDLMRYLCRLVTPPSGTVLDPFAGSGSTGKAAMLEGFDFIGIDAESEYAEIARARLGLSNIEWEDWME